MKIFISWSETRSRRVAHALRDWLPRVLHAADPFMSEKDILPGTNWVTEISNRLQDSQIGIICVTPEGMTRPWLNFEAGALSNHLNSDTTLIVPYLHGFIDGTIQPPLSYFQAVNDDHDGTLELVKTINTQLKNLGQYPLTEAILNETFEKWWQVLADRLANIPKPADYELPIADSDKFPYSSFYYGGGKNPRRGDVYQDFVTVQKVKRGNVNAIQWLWADTTAGSHIRAQVVEKNRFYV